MYLAYEALAPRASLDIFARLRPPTVLTSGLAWRKDGVDWRVRKVELAIKEDQINLESIDKSGKLRTDIVDAEWFARIGRFVPDDEIDAVTWVVRLEKKSVTITDTTHLEELVKFNPRDPQPL